MGSVCVRRCGSLAVATTLRHRVPKSMSSQPETAAATAEVAALAAEVRLLAAAAGVTPLPGPAPVRSQLNLLGQALAFDKVLSGNRDISCMTATCAGSVPWTAAAFAIGQGAPASARRGPIPRERSSTERAAAVQPARDDNAHLGRPGIHRPQGIIRTPGATLLASQRSVLECGAASALGRCSPCSRASEMRAVESGNELAAVADNKHQDIWAFLMRRLGDIPEYRTMFESRVSGRALR